MNLKAKMIVVFCVLFGTASISFALPVTGTRDLPDNYEPGQTVAVTLDLEVDEGNKPESVIIRETLPDVDWADVDISATPMFSNNDPDFPLKYYKNTGYLEWLFVDGLMGFSITDTSMDIAYQVTAPADATGTKTFSGKLLYNPGNITQDIDGDTVIEPVPPPIPTVGFSSASTSNPEATSPVTLAVALSNAYIETVQVSYSVSGGTATQGNDYVLNSGILTFTPGNTAPDNEIEITVVSDSLYEADETIIVTLSSPVNATLGTNPHTYTIENDDPPPSIEFNVTDSSGFEDNSPAELTVNISVESGLLAKVDYSVTPGTASSGQDYTPVSGVLTFPAGSTDSQTISIPIIDDLLDEEDYETFIVTLSNPFNATLGTKTSHTYTIIDNDNEPSVGFTATGSQDYEGDEGENPQKTLVVNLTPASGRTVTVGYTVTGTADGGVDYTIAAGPLTFSPGEITKNILLTIVGDNFGEGNETVIITLSSPENATLGANASYTHTIENDDESSVDFTTASSSGPESDSQVNLTVTLLPEFQELVTVNYSVSGGTATGNGEDYTLESGTLTFVSGDTEETIEISITDDAIEEPDETIIVTLSEPSAGATIGANESHTYTIENDDDETDPNTYGHIPELDSIQVARDTIIQLHITDTMIGSTSGVDLDTVKIQIEGVIIYNGDVASYDSDLGICRRVEITEGADYMFVFQPSTLFDYEQEVDVVVYAEDKAGNIVDETYHFHTVMRSFGKNIKVNSDTGTLVQNRPATATDSAGNTWVVWDQTTAAGDTDIYIGKLLADESVFGESMPVISDANDQLNPAIAIDNDDMIYVAWQGNDPNGYWDIFTSTSTNGTDWSNPVKVFDGDPHNESDQTSPAIAIDGAGKAYIAWEDNRKGNKDICVATSSGGPSWASTLVTIDENDQTEPTIAIGVENTEYVAYIAWTDARNAAERGTDIYGAKSTSWNENVEVVNTNSNQSSPVAAVSEDGVVHLLWVDDENGYADIFYGNDASDLPIEGTTIVDEPDTVQSSPAIAVNGTKIFACWQDARNVTDNNADIDIYYAESGSDFGTNILANDDLGADTQTAPVIGIDTNGNPYMGWVDNRLGNNDIYGVATTSIGELLQSTTVMASDTNTQFVQINEASDGVDDVDDVIVEIPAGALSADTTVTIAEIANLPELPPGGFGVCYEFGPSGLEFNQPVTITIPHAAADCPGHSVYNVYWYDPSILPPASPWTQEDITDVEHLTLPSGIHVIRFNTTHFTGFGIGGSAPGIVSGGGGGGGGCALSPNGQGNVIDYMLPYVFYVVVLLIITLKDARKRKTI